MPTDSRYSNFPKSKRKVGGVTYHYIEWRKLRAVANAAATRWQAKSGLKTIILPAANGWAIYQRGVLR